MMMRSDLGLKDDKLCSFRISGHVVFPQQISSASPQPFSDLHYYHYNPQSCGDKERERKT